MKRLKAIGVARTGLLLAGWMGFAVSARSQAVQPSQPAPAYEVATIKPWDGKGWGRPLRVYIQGAYGIPVNSTGWVIGPDWIESAKYAIQGKAPDSIREAMQNMTPEQRRKEIHLLQQSLLADRFKLKAHFETRQMPQFQLVLAKGGPKLKEDPDTTKAQAVAGNAIFRGTAVSMAMLADLLQSVPDIGGRVIIDKTGLTGTYDFSLRWAPLGGGPAADVTATPSSSDGEATSLFTAIQEQLGLKLVLTKGLGQVLVIDHIERPSEN